MMAAQSLQFLPPQLPRHFARGHEGAFGLG
ncbi:uncharacterized protein METZ01_LOCUS323954, partial [marine metagenome]